jgi:hypothetical protein
MIPATTPTNAAGTTYHTARTLRLDIIPGSW